jgi:SM-20-related protein
MSQPLTSTLLLRGGHRWVCATADTQAILAYLSAPQPDPHKMFTLRGVDGQTLTIPAREIVGVVGDDRQAVTLTQAAPPRMRKEATLGGSPYLIIDDFLDNAAFDQVLNFALSQEAVYAAATVTDTTSDYRKAKVLFDVAPVQPLFVPRIQAMTAAAFAQLTMLPVAVKTIECQLTAHGEGDYFKRHNDNGSPETAGRTLSYVYYFNRAPRGFSGGHLRMYETVVADGYYTAGTASQDIEPRCNSMILFPSYCHHEVTPVKCPSGEFGDRRFTVNGWVVRSM